MLSANVSYTAQRTRILEARAQTGCGAPSGWKCYSLSGIAKNNVNVATGRQLVQSQRAEADGPTSLYVGTWRAVGLSRTCGKIRPLPFHFTQA